MTNILIEHNPFDVKTKIMIDGEPVVETSGLYKYLNTPMQDWVATFLPTLIEHCNDDELEITFKGLQYNYDDLEKELDQFLKENRDYDIHLDFDCCEGQRARLGKIASVIDDMQSQTIVEELRKPEFAKAFSAPDRMQVLVMGGTDQRRYEFINTLLETHIERADTSSGICYTDNDMLEDMQETECKDGFRKYSGDISFVSSEFCQTVVYELPNLENCENNYYRFGKKAIVGEEKTLVIYILENRISKSDAEFLNMIAEQYKQKGKRNKQRFLFAAEDPAGAKQILKSEFSIKSAPTYGLDDAVRIRRKIEEYQDEVCLVAQVKEKCALLLNKLSNLENALTLAAAKNKDNNEIDELECTATNLLYKSSLIYSPLHDKDKTIENVIGNILEQLSEDYEKTCFAPERVLGTLPMVIRMNSEIALKCEHARRNISFFVRKLLDNISNYLDDISKFAEYEIEIKYDPELSNVLRKLGIGSAMEKLQEWVKEQQLQSQRSFIPKEMYLEEIKDIKIEKDFPRIFGVWYVDSSYATATRKDNSDGTRTFLFPFTVGLTKFCSENLYGDGYVSLENKANSVAYFKKEIGKIRPVMRKYYYDCISAGKKNLNEMDRQFETELTEFENAIHEQAQRLREAAEISENEKQRLSYVRQMQERIEKITCL